MQNPSMSTLSKSIEKNPNKNTTNLGVNLEKLTPIKYENGFKEYYNSNNHTPVANILTL